MCKVKNEFTILIQEYWPKCLGLSELLDRKPRSSGNDKLYTPD